MDVEVTVDGDTATVVLTGELELATVTALRRGVDELIAAGRPRISIDVAAVSFVDSTGLGALLYTKRRCEAAGGSFALTGVHGRVLRLLEVLGLSRYFGGDQSRVAPAADGQPGPDPDGVARGSAELSLRNVAGRSPSAGPAVG